MDELGISVLTYDEMLFLIDFSVDYYTALRDLGVHSTFKYEDFRLINYSDNTALTSHTLVATMSDGTTTISYESRGTISWEKQGNSWKIKSEGKVK